MNITSENRNRDDYVVIIIIFSKSEYNVYTLYCGLCLYIKIKSIQRTSGIIIYARCILCLEKYLIYINIVIILGIHKS